MYSPSARRFIPALDAARARLVLGAFITTLVSANCGGNGGARGTGGGAGGGGAGGGGNGAGGAGDLLDCRLTPTGTGTLTVTVVGLPDTVVAEVLVVGTRDRGAKSIRGTTTFSSLPNDRYYVMGLRVASTDPIVRTVYVPTMDAPLFAGIPGVCVGGGASPAVTVTYTPLPSSNKLWVANSGSPEGLTPVAFSSAQLTATATVPAVVGAASHAGRIQAFDSHGNLWAVGGTVADPTILRLPAQALGTSGAKVADLEITIPAIDCLPAVSSLALRGENLWVGSTCKHEIYSIDAPALAVSGAVVPIQILSVPGGADGLAFDAEGNLWAATGPDGKVLRFDFDRTSGKHAATPSLTLTATNAAAALGPGALAFDAAGNLWSNDFGGNVVFPFPPEALAGTGAVAVTPPVVITLGVTALLGGMAFDEGGGLWLPLAAGSIGRLSPTQLAVSSGPGAPTVPARIITSPTLGSAENLSFYPAPAALPLASAFPMLQ